MIGDYGSTAALIYFLLPLLFFFSVFYDDDETIVSNFLFDFSLMGGSLFISVAVLYWNDSLSISVTMGYESFLNSSLSFDWSDSLSNSLLFWVVVEEIFLETWWLFCFCIWDRLLSFEVWFSWIRRKWSISSYSSVFSSVSFSILSVWASNCFDYLESWAYNSFNWESWPDFSPSSLLSSALS